MHLAHLTNANVVIDDTDGFANAPLALKHAPGSKHMYASVKEGGTRKRQKREGRKREKKGRGGMLVKNFLRDIVYVL